MQTIHITSSTLLVALTSQRMLSALGYAEYDLHSGQGDFALRENSVDGLVLYWYGHPTISTEADVAALLASPEWLAYCRTGRLAALYQRRVKAEKSPFLHDGRRYDGGDDSIERFGVISQQITWALMAGQPAEATILQSGWRDVEGTPGPTTIGGLQALLMAHYQHGVACELNSQQIKAAINAAATVDELDAIDLDAGWP